MKEIEEILPQITYRLITAVNNTIRKEKNGSGVVIVPGVEIPKEKTDDPGPA